AMVCASVILRMTRPELLVGVVRMGVRPRAPADTFWRFPKSTLEEVSLPVRATPSQPRSAEKKGKSFPVLAKARPIVESEPEYRVVKPRSSIATREGGAHATR